MDSGSETLKRLKQKKCRICLSEQNLTPLFRRGLGLKVMQLADIKIYEGDGLPTTICMDCELEVKRCHNFVAQIKRADAKLREMLENGEDSSEISEKEREVVGSNDSEVSDCQIDIEECNVKQEAYPFDHLIDEKAEIHSNSDNDHLYETEDNNDQMEDETEFNQINHVDVVECSDTMATEGMEVSEDPLGEESLIDTQKSLKTECETTADPLTCMKQENLESMDVDKGTSVAATLSPQPLIAAPPTPQPSTSSSVVRPTKLILIWPHILAKAVPVQKIPMQKSGDVKYQTPKTKLASTPNTPTLDKGNSNQLPDSPIPSTSGQSLLRFALEKRKAIEKPDLYENFKKMRKESTSFCYVCKIDCTSYEMLKEHEEKEGFMCRICALDVKSHIDLEIHFFSHKPYKCNVCHEFFMSKVDVSEHKKRDHPSTITQCNICKQTFLNKSSLHPHKIAKHSNYAKMIKCIVCSKSFRDTPTYQNHLVSVHTAYEHLECKVCQALILGPDKLKMHIKGVHIVTTTNSPVPCQICGVVLSRSASLAKHMLTHDETETVCEHCGEMFKGKHMLSLHLFNKHSEKGAFNCRYCNMQFNSKNKIKLHYRKCETKGRKSRTHGVCCEICGKQLRNTSILKRHKLIHTEDRPFVCGICEATFKQKSTLRTHTRVHNDGDKYSCDMCGNCFKWKSTFDRHVKLCEGDINL